jgi:hypothetical protein
MKLICGAEFCNESQKAGLQLLDAPQLRRVVYVKRTCCRTRVRSMVLRSRFSADSVR